MRQIRLFGDGFLVVNQESHFQGLCKGGARRGAITSFGFSSRLRLRKALLEYFVPSTVRVGATLTLPWRSSSADMSLFKDCMHRFRMSWRRRFPCDGFIYRVELQQRGSPHIHMIAYHRPPVEGLVSEYFSLWYSAVRLCGRDFSLDDFSRFGICLDFGLDMAAAIRYFCDHASKHKQAQLGYKGKQWGIVGRDNFVRRSGFPFEVGDREFVLLRRFCSRLCRFRIKASCVFGSKLSRKRRGFSVCYVDDDVTLRFLASLSRGEVSRS